MGTWIFMLVGLSIWLTLLGWLKSRFGWKGGLIFLVILGVLKAIAS